MPKLLVVTTNLFFLGFLDFLDYQTKILRIDLNRGLISKGMFYLSLKPRLKYLSRSNDVIFCEWFNKFSVLMSRLSSKPIFIRLHRFEIDNPDLIKKASFENVKGIVTVSHFYKSLVEKAIGKSAPIHVIRNGVDIEKFSFSKTIHRPLRICSLSNLIPRKRVFDLIVNNPSLALDLGGDGISRRVIEDAISRFRLQAQVCGHVELPRFYHDHDIFVMNSMDESCGLALLEAMSCGLIPFCFEWGGVREILPREHTYRNYEELKSKIDALREKSDSEILDLKRHFRNLVEVKNDLRDQAKMFESLFESAI